MFGFIVAGVIDGELVVVVSMKLLVDACDSAIICCLSRPGVNDSRPGV